MQDMYDVVIVGAGPVGLYTAKLLEGLGLKIVVFEEHQEVGKPVQCSGLISANLDKLMKVKENWVEHKVRKAVLHFGDQKIRLEKKQAAAYVINRGKFDKFLADQVKSEIMFGTKVDSVEISKNCAEIKSGKNIIKSKMVLGCDGPNSVVARSMGVKPAEILNGLIAIEQKADISDNVDLWFDKEKLPDGFFWRIPRGAAVEYGMLGKNVKFADLENFFKIKNYEKRAGLIPMGPPKTYFDRVLLIGDAAGMTKPWSGGGIIYGLTASAIAYEVVREAFEKNDFSEDFLKKYEDGWKSVFGRQIFLGMSMRRVYKKLGKTHIDFFTGLVKNMNFNWLDMDFL